MVVIFDMNTGAIHEVQGSRTAPEKRINTPEPEDKIAVQLEEAESVATRPEVRVPPILHQNDTDSFLHLMEAKTRQSR